MKFKTVMYYSSWAAYGAFLAYLGFGVITPEFWLGMALAVFISQSSMRLK